jgi:hypothetical protein
MEQLLNNLDLEQLQLADVLTNYRMHQPDIKKHDSLKDIDGFVSRLPKDEQLKFREVLHQKLEEKQHVDMNKQIYINYPEFEQYKGNPVMDMVVSIQTVSFICNITTYIQFSCGKTLCIYWGESYYRRLAYYKGLKTRQIIIIDTKSGQHLEDITSISRAVSNAGIKRGLVQLNVKPTKDNMEVFKMLCEKRID